MKWTKKKVTNLFFIIGVVAVVVMLFTFDVSFIELWQHICRAGLWLIPIIGIWIIIYGFNALSWHSIIRSTTGDRNCVNFMRIYKLTISGYALNYATPVGGLGGEPYRIMELSKNIGNQQATSSVILYVMMHFLAHFLFWFASIFIYIGLAWHGYVPLSIIINILLGITILVCLLAIYLFSRGYRNGMAYKLIRFLCKLPGLKRWGMRFLRKHGTALHNIDNQIAALHKQDKKTFYYSLSIEWLSRVVQSLEIMFMLLLFGIDNGGDTTGLLLTFLESVLILAITTLCANIIGFLPMQLGVQEGGFVFSIFLLGLEPAFGIFVCIICRVREILWITIGLILMKINPKRPIEGGSGLATNTIQPE